VSYNAKDNTYKNLEDLKPYVMLMIYQSPKDSVLVINTGTRLSVMSDKIMNTYIDFDLPKLKSKKYTIRWGLQNSFDEPTINSRAYASKDFVIEK
jgi:hypothetical protein